MAAAVGRFVGHAMLWGLAVWATLPLCAVHRFQDFQLAEAWSWLALAAAVLAGFVVSYRVLCVCCGYVSPRGRRHALVLCLGDIGRSPRMQYHSLSLADLAGLEVSVVGYGGSRCHQQVLSNPHITLRVMRPFAVTLPRSLRLVYYALKVGWQVTLLAWAMLYGCPAADVLLVQNPPSIPSLAVCVLVKLCSGCTFIIDWHNFGYTILALALGPRHPLVTAAYYYERVLGRFSDANLCVTRAMREWLRAEWGVQASVLHDKAPAIFRRLPLHEVHELWTRLQQDPKLSCLLGSMHVDCKRGDTILTSASSSSSSSSRRKSSSKKRKGSAKGKRGSRKSPKGAEGVSWREGRPAVLISSTSWTADEDFNVLLEAVKECEAHLLRAHKKKKKKEKDAAASPQLLVLITGKGPMRAMYEEQIEGLGLQMTAIKTLWLEAEDYPRLLGSADLGVSLHTSSSGLDLPMKVVDMFGAQLPVCAIDFKCLGELVQHQQNGLVFQDSAQLAAQLVEYVLEDRPGFAKIEELRTGVADFTETRWDDAWRVSALPFFRPLSSLS